MKRRWVLLGVLLLPLVLIACVVGARHWVRELERNPPANSGRPGSWMTVSSERATDFARIRLPASASEVRWSYLIGFQDDLAFLSFRLPPGEEQGFLAGLGIAIKPNAGTDFGTYGLEGFHQAGAPDPTTAGPLRYGSFIAEPLPGHNKRLGESVWLAAEADGGTRVWVSAMDAP
ncbi:hypothetical protein [Streptomyces sp. LS1784]|uniref:hypothetical protein n=1 Tax=Streptomyces sp. LS1784 TaxID=2851533 RepID=UPI001CCCC11D|nr:hypothetical protein [Streptomyces sp. LS1784]